MANNLDIDIRVKWLEEAVRKIKGDMKGAGDSVENNVTKKGVDGAGKIGQAFSKLKNIIGAAFVATGLLGFGRQLLQLWSDLNETESKFGTVFGNSSKRLDQELTVMSDAVWRSKLDLMGWTSTLGNILQPLWFTRDASADLSKEITKLAIDVASFNNVPDDTAVNALTKWLLGEREALKWLGIAISEQEVAEKALTLQRQYGIDATSKQAKALATYQLYLEKTKNAQGDAVITAEWFANQLKRLQSVIKDTMASAGKDVSQQTGSILWDISDFIKTYWGAIFAVLIEVGKAIMDFFSEVWSMVWWLMDALGITLWDGWDKVSWFGKLVLLILNGMSAGVKIFTFVLKSLVDIFVAVMQDIAVSAMFGLNIITGHFKATGAIIGDVFAIAGNNIVAGIEKGINESIKAVNWFVNKINDLVWSKIFGNIGTIGQREFKSFSTAGSQAVWELNQAYANFNSSFWSNTANAFARASTGADDMLGSIISSIDATNARVKKSNKDTVSNYDTSLADISKFIGWAWDAWASAWDKTAGGTKKATDATKELKKEIDKLEDWYKKYEKWVKDVESATEDMEKANKKMTDTIKTGLQWVSDDLKKVQKEYDETIAKINQEQAQTQWENIADFVRSQAEKEASIKMSLDELQKEQDSLAWQQDTADRINDIVSERLRLTKQLEEVQSNLTTVTWDQYKTLLEWERARAWLSEDKIALLDFQTQQQKADQEAQIAKDLAQKKYDEEVKRLEWLQQVYNFFDGLKTMQVFQLEKLKKDEYYKWLTEEQKMLFDKLLVERQEYMVAVNTKKRMEFELANSIKKMSDDVTAYLKLNVASMGTEYQTLINQIQSAISLQGTLNSMRTEQRYKWWPVSAGQPYLIGENPDGSINPTTEMFVPSQSGSILNAQKTREILSQALWWQQSIDQSRNFTVQWGVNFRDQFDFEDYLQRVKFKWL